MIRDKMQSESWDQRYLKEIINAKKIKNRGRNGRKSVGQNGMMEGKEAAKKVVKNQPIIKQNVKKKDDRVE